MRKGDLDAHEREDAPYAAANSFTTIIREKRRVVGDVWHE